MNLIEAANKFYKKTPPPITQDKRRDMHINELLFVIDTAPFLTPDEKTSMSQLMPLYPTKVIKNIHQSLIKQGIIFLKMNPIYKDSMNTWLDNADKKHKKRA